MVIQKRKKNQMQTAMSLTIIVLRYSRFWFCLYFVVYIYAVAVYNFHEASLRNVDFGLTRMSY